VTDVIVDRLPTRDELVDLYASVGWSAYTDDRDRLVAGVDASPFVATVRDGDLLVGLARAVSDDATIAYLQDLLVRPSHQRRGVGRALVGAFLDRYAHVRQRVLLTDDDATQHAFYRAVGMTRADEVAGDPLWAFVDLGGG
jgi:GNAT superfamily N-acetyltransferase